MALTDNGSDFTMPVAPLYGGGNNGFGGGFADGGAFWLLVLFLFAFNGGWGNGFGGNAMPYVVNNDVQRGFDQSAIMSSLAGINNAITSGFATAELGRANANTDLLQTLWGIQSQQQACCCDTRQAITGVAGAIATEGAESRYANAINTRDILENANRNNQAILDKLCQLELDGKQQKINDLERDLLLSNLNASQVQQTAQIQAGQVAEIDAMYQRLKDCPVPTMPVYGMTPIFSCGNNGGCGCGNF